MKCPACGMDNPTSARFCGGCGAGLIATGETARARSMAVATTQPKTSRRRGPLALFAVVAILISIGGSALWIHRSGNFGGRITSPLNANSGDLTPQQTVAGYTVTDLGQFFPTGGDDVGGTAGGLGLDNAALNDNGSIIGNGIAGGACVWRNGRQASYGEPSQRAQLVAINDNGDVILATRTTPRADLSEYYLVNNGQWTDITAEAVSAGITTRDVENNAFEFAVYGLNDRDEAIGTGGAGGFAWQDGRFTMLGHAPSETAMPKAINNLGTIVGWVSVNAYGSDARPASWTGGRVTYIPLPTRDGSAQAISDNGDIALGYELGKEGCETLSLVAGIMTDLGRAVGAPGGMNDAGQIIMQGGNAPIAYVDGRMQDLNNMISPESGWDLIWLSGINNRGQIVGRGKLNGSPAGFLLTPYFGNPPPDATSEAPPIAAENPPAPVQQPAPPVYSASVQTTWTNLAYSLDGPPGVYEVKLFEVGAASPSRDDMVTLRAGSGARGKWYSLVSKILRAPSGAIVETPGYYIRITRNGRVSQTNAIYFRGSAESSIDVNFMAGYKFSAVAAAAQTPGSPAPSAAAGP